MHTKAPRSLFRSPAGRQAVHERYRALLAGCPVPLAERRVPTGQGETFVLACGPADAPPVVLLHGSATTAAMWLRNLPAWSRECRVYALDLIGEPGFSAPARPPLRSDAHARWLEEVWAGLGLSEAAVVGASYGGWLALDYAIRRPGRVRSLALLAPAGIAPLRPGYLFTVAPLLLAGAGARRRAVERILGVPPAELTADARAFIDFFELVMTHFRIRTTPMPILRDAELRSLRMPVLAILGERDVVFRADLTRRRLAACVPQARVEILPGHGHALSDTTATVLAFLRESRSAPRLWQDPVAP